MAKLRFAAGLAERNGRFGSRPFPSILSRQSNRRTPGTRNSGQAMDAIQY